jgi:hypothetical protein
MARLVSNPWMSGEKAPDNRTTRAPPRLHPASDEAEAVYRELLPTRRLGMQAGEFASPGSLLDRRSQGA